MAEYVLPATLVTPDKKSLSLSAYFFLAVLALAFFLPGFVTLPPTDRDESLFSQATKQMVETGNYVDIRYQKEPRYKKPIGIYWLQAVSVHAFGYAPYNQIWVYRLPSLAGAVTAVLATAAIGATLFTPMVGFIAALMMASSLLLNVEARLAKTDAALLASILLMQLALARAYMNKAGKFNFFLFWMAMAGGILIKGPIILLVLFSTLLWLKFSKEDFASLKSLHPWFGVPLLLVLVAPWFVAIMLQSKGDFATQSAGHDLLTKIWQGQGHGILPPGLHALVYPAIFFPCSLFVLLAIPDTWFKRHERVYRFCLGWLIPSWCIFELSLTKLPHYVMPLYPVLALLAAKAFCDGYPVLAASTRRWWPAISVTLWIVIGFALAAANVALIYVANDHVIGYAQILVGMLLFITQTVALIMLIQRKVGSITLLVSGYLLFSGCVFGMTLPKLQHLWLAKEIMSDIAANVTCKPHILSASYNEPSMIFLGGTETQQINDATTLADTLQKTSCGVAVLDAEHKSPFLDAAIRLKIQPIQIGVVSGYNLGSGHHVDLTIYTLASMSTP